MKIFFFIIMTHVIEIIYILSTAKLPVPMLISLSNIKLATY